MLVSDIPLRISVSWAQNGSKNSIPNDSLVATKPGAASWSDGFPPATRTALTAGGVPPSGLDMNGGLSQISQWIKWYNAGGPNFYNADFAAKVGGYPKGALITASGGGGYWINGLDGNQTDPDNPQTRNNWTSLAGLGGPYVLQGTGVGQLGNLVKIGWSGTKVKATIDVTDMGNIAFESWVNGLLNGEAQARNNADVAEATARDNADDAIVASLTNYTIKGQTLGASQRQVFNPGAGWVVKNTLTFKTNGSGYLYATASVNIGNAGGTNPNGCTNGIYYDGALQQSDNTQASMTNTICIAIAAGSHQLEQIYQVSAVAGTYPPTSTILSYIFVPA